MDGAQDGFLRRQESMNAEGCEETLRGWEAEGPVQAKARSRVVVSRTGLWVIGGMAGDKEGLAAL